MAGADGSQLRDVTKWAASFMARLFAGAAPGQLLAEEGVCHSSGSCTSLYRSVSTEEDDLESDGDTRRRSSDEFGADANESDQEQLLAADDGEYPRRARSVCCERSLSHGGVQHTMSSMARELTRRHSTGAGDAAMEAAESEPLMLRRRAAKLANDVEKIVDHPFGCGRRERESSSLLLLSS